MYLYIYIYIHPYDYSYLSSGGNPYFKGASLRRAKGSPLSGSTHVTGRYR